jgi:hypothetical protein
MLQRETATEFITRTVRRKLRIKVTPLPFFWGGGGYLVFIIELKTKQ